MQKLYGIRVCVHSSILPSKNPFQDLAQICLGNSSASVREACLPGRIFKVCRTLTKLSAARGTKRPGRNWECVIKIKNMMIILCGMAPVQEQSKGEPPPCLGNRKLRTKLFWDLLLFQ